MSNWVAKIVALLSLAGFAIAMLVLATGSSEAAKKYSLPGSVALGGECAAFQDCHAVTGKIIECRCTEQRPFDSHALCKNMIILFPKKDHWQNANYCPWKPD